jgi:phosphoserine aminotransferase
MMARVFNFSAGPAALPLEVIEEAQANLSDWQGLGMSVMEISHRSKAFGATAEQAESDLRELLNISADYAVLFLQGGATQQFALIPMNFAGSDRSADYLLTGSWSKKAYKTAAAVCRANVAADAAESSYNTVPDRDDWQCDDQAAYFHYAANETIGGVEIHDPPEVGSVPLVSDMSSTILSRPIDVNRFGMIYAGAQKNVGPAGLTIVIIRRDLLEKGAGSLPPIMSYAAHAAEGSMLNTPPTFAWYMAGLVFVWLKGQGGLEKIAAINERKSRRLYAAIDESSFYSNPVDPAYRSWMNVPFILARPELDGDFLAEAEQQGLTNLKGHRSVGGMRASIYNAVPEAAIDALLEFMAEFERRHA